MLDAILARDAAARKAAAAAKLAEKAAKLKEDKHTLALEDAAKLAEEAAKLTAVKKKRALALEDAAAPPPKKEKVDQPAPGPKPTLPTKGTIQHEKSRYQYLLRVPGQKSRKFRYLMANGIDKGEYDSDAEALAAAQAQLMI